jgi:hypothetical protein
MSTRLDDQFSVPLNWEEYPSSLPCQPNDVDPENMTYMEDWLSRMNRSDRWKSAPTKVHVARFRCPGDGLEKLFFSDAEELAAFIEDDVRTQITRSIPRLNVWLLGR